MISDFPACYCGHVDDEHLDGHRECEVEGCDCVLFDEDPDG